MSWSGWAPSTPPSASEENLVSLPRRQQTLFTHPLCFSESTSHSFLSSFACPEPKTTASSALSVSVSGLLLPQDVHRLVQQIQ